MSRWPPADRPTRLLLTCEHGGCDVPEAYRHLFRGHQRVLKSHRGLDIGALAAARYLQRHLKAPLISATVTRLLVDVNRSARHPALFSEFSRRLSAQERSTVLSRHYHPYRRRVHDWIAERISGGERVLHLSVHSFTPVLDGEARRADIGLLYDPARGPEAELCRSWQKALSGCAAGWTVRRNYPYRGAADGQVVDLRRKFSARCYRGIEIEINQGCVARPAQWSLLPGDLAATLPAGRSR